MKIGIFTECYKPVMNGVVVSIETFKEGLEKLGHEVFVFAPEHKDAKKEKNVFRFPSIRDKKNRLYPIFVPSISLQKKHLPEDIVKNLDVIHTQHMFTAGRLARYVARKYNKPLVYTYHTLIAEYTHYAGFFSRIVGVYLKNMSKRFCNSCNRVITPSFPMRDILRRYGVDSSIDVIMTGIEPRNYRHLSMEEIGEVKEKYGIDRHKKICLYLSRIAKEKNLDFLLKAFVKILEKYPMCHLLMVGGGPEENWVKKRVRELEIETSVTMTGMLPKLEANQMFGVADIFVFSSISETQGIVIAEAMASETPPVAVGKMGPTDLVHNGRDGFLTKLAVSDFVEKTVTLLRDDELRDRFAKEGLSRVNEFSTDESVRKMISLYESVIGSKTDELHEELAFKS